jgi:hypothetical protein
MTPNPGILKRLRWGIAAALFAATAAWFAWPHLVSLDGHLWATPGSQESYYWAAAQTQLALAEVEARANAIALGAPLGRVCKTGPGLA